ncbi:hypothetical protein LXL04_007404 [Taraxacum kok-saghyz]
MNNTQVQTRPISVILDGTNYVMWNHHMTIHLKSLGLYSYVTGTTTPPVKSTDETDIAFGKRTDDWDIKNAKILGFFNASTTTDIHQQFLGYTTGKQVWDLLARRFTTTGLSHQYHLWSAFQSKRQQPDQSISQYVSEMQIIQDQLNAAAPQIFDETANQFRNYFSHLHLITLLMGLLDKFENVRASLLHRHPLPTLDASISELISEETRIRSRFPASSEAVLHVPFSGHKGKPYEPKVATKWNTSECSFCKSPTHLLLNCPIRSCKWCNVKHPRHYGSDCPKNPRNTGSHRPSFRANTVAGSISHETLNTTNTVSTPNSDLMELMRKNQEMMERIMSGCMGANEPGSSLGNMWLFDSGCCNHMTPLPNIFTTKLPSQTLPSVSTANGTRLPITHSGHVSTPHLSLHNAVHVPNLSVSLVSVGQLCESGLCVLFSFFGCLVQDPQTKETLGIGRRVGKMFEVVYLRLPPSSSNLVASTFSLSSFDIWHARLGHISQSRLKLLVQSGVLGTVKTESIFCSSCQLGKHHALPFVANEFKSTEPFDLIHSDVWGPAPHFTMGGARYFVIFIDDCTRFTWIYLMKHRSELPHIYITFARMIQTQFSKPIKIFRADNAMEYKASSLLSFLREQGTMSQYSCPGTSQQNGRAERKHRHILDTIRTLLISSQVPERFWGEAAFTAVYTINRHPTPVLQNKSPYELLHKTLPGYDLLRVWGCACFVQLQSHERSKLEPRSRLCCFIGYGIEHKGYRCWDPISKRLRISRHVTFWEHKMFSSISKFQVHSPSSSLFFTDISISFDSHEPEFHDNESPPLSSTSTHLEDQIEDPTTTSQPIPESSPQSPDPLNNPSLDTRPQRVRHIPSHLRDFHCYATLFSHHEPSSYKEAITNPLWQNAMQEELQALKKAQTWNIVPLPPGKSLIGSKWIYKVKTRSDGTVERYKARLVAKGFDQEYGIDYEETFAPVARITSVRSLLAIAAARHWSLYQMDVKNAFLNGDLAEEVYMRPPRGVDHPPGHVCHLQKALYGLKQAPRAWFEKFSTTVLSLGFSSSPYDSGLFTRTTETGTILLLLYVDDMIITGSDNTGILQLKQSLSSCFQMKDLGNLHYFLGLEVLADTSGIYLCQAKYISDLLSRSGLTDAKVASTPLEPNTHLVPQSGTPLNDPTAYRQLVGSLVYLTVTRPDLAYAVHTVSQFMASPYSNHYAAVLRILRYLKGTMFHGLHFSSKSSLVLKAFSDADWDGDLTDRRSTTGYCFFLGDSLISWRSKKQSLTARSSTESEYRALADTTQELVWLRWLLADMCAPQSLPTSLWCDNNSAIQIAHNDVFHERTKHIEIDCHFVRQHVVRKTVHLLPISTVDQPADIFTKAHLSGRFQFLVSKLKMMIDNEDVVKHENLYMMIQERHHRGRVADSRHYRGSIQDGLKKESPFCENLVMTPCRKLDEVRNTTLRFIRLEEDKMIQKKLMSPGSYEQPNRKSYSSSQRSYKSKPYNRKESQKVKTLEDEENDEDYPKISDYSFSVDTTGLIYAIQDIGDKARWPKKKEKSNTWKDRSMWCNHHEDFRHRTEDCNTLGI